MKIQSKNDFSGYIDLRKKIDTDSKKLESEHSEHLECKIGCDLCCMDYRIFPIEFYSVLDEIKQNKIEPNKVNLENAQDNSCIFLKNHKCIIYSARPIICRTHGLPLLFTNDNSEWELSACELNFTDFDFGEFTFDNTFLQDKFNSKLFLLNKKFISEFKEKRYTAFDLIPLKNIINEL